MAGVPLRVAGSARPPEAGPPSRIGASGGGGQPHVFTSRARDAPGARGGEEVSLRTGVCFRTTSRVSENRLLEDQKPKNGLRLGRNVQPLALCESCR